MFYSGFMFGTRPETSLSIKIGKSIEARATGPLAVLALVVLAFALLILAVHPT